MSVDRPSRLKLDVSDRDTFLPVIDLGEVLRSLMRKVLRRWTILAGSIALFVLLAVGYAVLSTPVYTANGSILIDPRVGSTPRDGSDMIPGLLLSDALTVDSELRVLVSREVTASVVNALELGNSKEATGSWTQLISDWLGLGGTAEGGTGLSPQALEERRAEALRRSFVRGLKVERAGESFVLDISYTSPQVEFASLAVNTVMKEYLRLSSEQQINRAERTREWLSDRIDELGSGVVIAETAVTDYQRDNQLLTPTGALLPTEIALNAAIAELVQQRTQGVSVDVQIRQLSDQIASGQIDAIQIPSEERTSALIEFEASYTDLLQQEQELLLVWDSSAPILENNRKKKAQLRELILVEYSQIVENLKSRRDTIGLQVEANERVIAELQSQYGEDATKTVQLRRLEREAESKRVLYEQMLEEYNSTSQLLTFDATSARVIAWAVAPDKKSAPQSKQIVILAALAGTILAFAGISLMEALDRSFREQQNLVEIVKLPFLGLIPTFRTERTNIATEGRPLRSARWRKLGRAAKRFDFAVMSPTSVSAETMRSIHVSLTMQKRGPSPNGMIVGLTSSVRGEGKTTTAFNLATYLAKKGKRVVLLDLDLVSRKMSQQIGSVLSESNTLFALLQDPDIALRQMQESPEFPGLVIVGNPAKGGFLTSATRDGPALKSALLLLSQNYDFVIVDLPPLQGMADTQLLARLCNRLIFVVRWGSTPKQQVVSSIRKIDLPEDKFLGVVFTQGKLREYRSYNPNEVTDYYS